MNQAPGTPATPTPPAASAVTAAADPQTTATATAAHAFIAKWRGVTASELATAQSFVIDLCDLLGQPRPHATPEQDYMFERPITFQHGDGSTSPGRVDCYRRGHFVWESKKLKAGIEGAFKGKGPWKKGLPRILDTLEALGRAQMDGAGWRG